MTTVLQKRIQDERGRMLDARLRVAFPGCEVMTIPNRYGDRPNTNIVRAAGHDRAAILGYADAYLMGMADAVRIIDPLADSFRVEQGAAARKPSALPAPQPRPKAHRAREALAGLHGLFDGRKKR